MKTHFHFLDSLFICLLGNSCNQNKQSGNTQDVWAIESQVAWFSGKIKGIVARGGFEMDIEWAEGISTQLAVRSLLGNDAKL